MQVTVDVNRRNTIRLLEALLGVASGVLGIARFMNALPWQGHLIYGSEPIFSLNALYAGGFATYGAIGMSLLLLVIAGAALFHTVRRSSASRLPLLAAVVGLAALVILTFPTIGALFLLSLVLGLGALALSFAWR